MKIDITTTWNGVPLPPEDHVRVRLRDEGDGLRLRVDAPWHRDPPPPGPPGPTDRLWEHEVVEIFVAGPGDPVPYTELEIGPYGHYLLLTFSGIRRPVDQGLPADVAVTRHHAGWRADARLPLAVLPPRPWRVNACAIHGVGLRRLHLSAVRLPGDAPDFHQPEAFLPYAEPPMPGIPPGA